MENKISLILVGDLLRLRNDNNFNTIITKINKYDK